MASLVLDGLAKTYANGHTALHGLDLAIEDGELVVVVGPSGCGKSTLLRLVAGLERATRGTIRLDGTDITHREPAARDMAMVFQNYALYPHMRVFENMAYGLRNRGMPNARIRERVRETAALLDIEALLERRPRELSGGQRQRVAMGRALVREPSVFLFDEPLSNLDAKLRVQMRLEIKRLQRRFATTTVYVTHDQVEAMTLADRLVVMKDGEPEQVDTAAAVYERPATQFVAGFIGSPSMNFIPVTAQAGRLALPGGGLLDAPGVDGEAVAGVRPEHLRPTGTGEANMILGVEMVEPLGANTLAYGRATEGGDLVVARLDGGHPVTAGDRLPLAIAANNVHLFAARDGRRIA